MNGIDYKDRTIVIEGISYGREDFFVNQIPAFANKSDFHNKLYIFLKEWYSDPITLTVKTSGSTGTPKELQVSKQRMLQSAGMTCSFLKLKSKDKVLLCMSLDYIAGKMIVVRALFADLDLYLVEPSGHPLAEIDIAFDFAAMIPLQVYNSLQDKREEHRLKNIKSLLIGGGSIDDKLAKALQVMPNKIYSTYGMTETLSHIALRKLSGTDSSPYYIPFHSVFLSLDQDNALIINAPLVSEEKLFTNDIAEIRDDGSCIIKGRRDNIINSGGIKIQAEVVEQELKALLGDIPFAITSLPDEKLGEKIILVVEKEIDKNLMNALPVYHKPKDICIAPIPLTETGKINRKLLKDRMVNKLKFKS